MSLPMKLEWVFSAPIFRPLVMVFGECRRLNHNTGLLVCVYWILRTIQKSFRTGKNAENIYCTTMKPSELLKCVTNPQDPHYRAYAKNLSLRDCEEPVVLVHHGRSFEEALAGECKIEVLNGTARIHRAQGCMSAMPVILISYESARKWGGLPFAEGLGARNTAPHYVAKGRRISHFAGAGTLPHSDKRTRPVLSWDLANKRATSVNAGQPGLFSPGANSLILSDCDAFRALAQRRLVRRDLLRVGLLAAFPDQQSLSPRSLATTDHQEKCLRILFYKLLTRLVTLVGDKDGKNYDRSTIIHNLGEALPVRELMRRRLGLPLLGASRADENYYEDRTKAGLDELIKLARVEMNGLQKPWSDPLPEALLLFGATHEPDRVEGLDKERLLIRYVVELLTWTMKGIFRARHWDIGAVSLRRQSSHGQFLEPDPMDKISGKIGTIDRIHHEAIGSVALQEMTALTFEQLLILAMHSRMNPFLIWHDLNWAVPLGHWMIGIGDLAAGRQFHVTPWMSECYLALRRNGFPGLNHFEKSGIMMVNWLHWTGERFPSFDLDLLRICKNVEADDKAHLVTIAENDDAKWLRSTKVQLLEDLALQATMFA